MAYAVLMLTFLFISLFADFQSQQFTLGWWVTFICLGGAIIMGIIYIGYAYLIHYINKETKEDNNG